ncbi:hypothetical protein FRC12_003683 [Ceratobasidium sp. 428]|nr:hypothetical protein FRC12_003683 [Ceratobasidium sp. 428]
MDIKCHALDNWKACRSALATAIRNYLAGCAELRSTCSQIQHQSRTRRELEPVLLAVNAELADLVSDETTLREARATLSVLRNTSSTLSPVHTLPPEILARIFQIAQTSPSHASSPSSPSPGHTFAQVCSYWRATATNLPYLWTHICIAPTQTSYEYATLSLHRSKGLPIYMNIYRQKVEKWDRYLYKMRWKTLLASMGRHVHALNIVDSFDSPETSLGQTIRLLLSHGSPGVMSTLHIRRPETGQIESLNPLSAGQSDSAVLHSISVLHLGNISIPWTSTIYHNLVDLRLQFHYDPQSILTSQLAGILAASLGLTILKLEFINIVPSEDWNEEKLVRLAHLKVLYLNNLGKNGLVALMSTLSLSSCLDTLEVGIHDCYDRYSEEGAHLAQDFLHGAHIKTLALTPNLDYNDDAQLVFSVFKMIPSLENLILDNYNIDYMCETRGMIDESETNVGTTSRLPNLFLVTQELDLEELKLIVSFYGVETLHLHGKHWNWPADELKTALLKSCHNLTCVISDEDPTIDWPCRTLFNRRLRESAT